MANGINQVGLVYTTQGFEYDYVGGLRRPEAEWFDADTARREPASRRRALRTRPR